MCSSDLVPTVYLEDRLMEKHDKLTPNMIEKMNKVIPEARQHLSHAFRSELKVAFGTDAGVYPHGENAHEFATMVRMGLPPLKAIQAATVNAADLIDGATAWERSNQEGLRTSSRSRAIHWRT